MKGNSHPSPRNPESPKQDEPKAKHPKTHINQINENQTQRENIKSIYAEAEQAEEQPVLILMKRKATAGGK